MNLANCWIPDVQSPGGTERAGEVAYQAEYQLAVYEQLTAAFSSLVLADNGCVVMHSAEDVSCADLIVSYGEVTNADACWWRDVAAYSKIKVSKSGSAE